MFERPGIRTKQGLISSGKYTFISLFLLNLTSPDLDPDSIREFFATLQEFVIWLQDKDVSLQDIINFIFGGGATAMMSRLLVKKDSKVKEDDNSTTKT